MLSYPLFIELTNLDLDKNFTHLALYDVSYLWYGPISFTICMILGIMISLAKPQDPKQLDSRLISPNTPSFLFWLPKKCKTQIKKYFAQVGSLHGSDRAGKVVNNSKLWKT